MQRLGKLLLSRRFSKTSANRLCKCWTILILSPLSIGFIQQLIDKEELYLNLVLDFVPETVHRIAKRYNRINERIPVTYVKLYTYQPLFPGESGVDQLVEIIKLEACIHPFFDELRDPNTRLPNGRPLPPLFNFKPQGVLEIYMSVIVKIENLKLGFLQDCLASSKLLVNWDLSPSCCRPPPRPPD